jgi:hypothetical protein
MTEGDRHQHAEEIQPLTGGGGGGGGGSEWPGGDWAPPRQAAVPPALRRALLVPQLSLWKRRCLRVPWYICSNCLFIAGCAAYLVAAREWLRLDSREGGEPAAAEWATYSRYTLLGAVLFVVEPALDFAGSWVAAVLATLEQARWEWERGAESGSGSSSIDGRASTPPPPPPLQRRLLLPPQWPCSSAGWVWTGYTVWEYERSTMCLIRSDLNFWAAVFFLIASTFYLYQALVPYLYLQDYCRCSDDRPGCSLSGAEAASASASASASAAVSPALSATAPAAREVGYCEAGWLAALTFLFDAAIGLAAWYANRLHVAHLLGGRKRSVDWLAVSATLFMVGAILEVADCVAEDAALNFVAQLCWLLNGVAYLIDAYDTRQLSSSELRAPVMAALPAAAAAAGVCSEQQELRWLRL